MFHHALGSCRSGGREGEYCTNPDRRAHHRLALSRCLQSSSAAVAPMANGRTHYRPGRYAWPPLRLRFHDRATDAGMPKELLAPGWVVFIPPTNVASEGRMHAGADASCRPRRVHGRGDGEHDWSSAFDADGKPNGYRISG